MRSKPAIFAALFCVLLVTLSCGRKEERSLPPAPGGGGTVDVSAFQKIESLKKILEKDRDNLKGWIMLGNLYFDTNKNEEAIKAYREALRLDPLDPNVRTDMGICLRRLGRIDEAVEAFRKAYSYKPDHYQSRYNLGLTLLHEKNDLQGALKEWEELLAHVPQFPGRKRLELQVESLKKMTSGEQGGEQGMRPQE